MNMLDVREKQKEDFHAALLNDDFKRAEKLLEQLKEEKDFALLRTLFLKIENKKPLFEADTGDLPSILSISPSYTCKLGCKFCITGFYDKTRLYENESYLSVEDFEKVLPWIDKAQTISFIGNGETLEAENLFKYLDKLGDKRKQELPIDIVSNGVLLTKEKIAKLLEIKNLRIIFSFDGRSAIGHGGGKEAYVKKIWGKVLLIQEESKRQGRKPPPISLITTLSKDNLQSLPEHLNEAEEYGIAGVSLVIMNPKDMDFYSLSLLPELPEALKRIEEIIQSRKGSPMEVALHGHSKLLTGKLGSCRYISDTAVFYKDMEQPLICCAPLQIPHKLTPEYSLEQYWNSFPLRLLRYGHAHYPKAYLPVECAECNVIDLELFATARKKRLMHPEDELYSGYVKGLKLKDDTKIEEAKACFKKSLKQVGRYTTRGRIYLHLCEISLMEEEYEEAREYIQKAVYYQFQHRKAFSYLYLLSMLTGKEPSLIQE